MSLFSSIRMGANILQAADINLQVIGQNIANANTEGYIREEVVLRPAPTQRYGGLLMGMGVEVHAVIQKIDNFLESRLRNATSDRAKGETLEDTYLQLESLIGELSDSDLSSELTDFFSAIAEVLNQPESTTIRNLAVLQGETVAQHIGTLSDRVRTIRSDLNERVIDMATDINRLSQQIAELNIQISATEGGDSSASDAVGLRDRRQQVLEELCSKVSVRIQEQPNGSVTVYTGGDFLVYEGVVRPVEAVLDSDRGIAAAEIHFVETDSPIDPESGELCGLLEARDDVLGNFLDSLDDFAATLAFEFNRVFSSGQGLNGYTQLTSEFAVSDTTLPLNEAGLKFTPANGSFQIIVRNTKTGEEKRYDIRVDLNGIGEETSLGSLVAAINDTVPEVVASGGGDRRLRLEAASAEHQFSFANDTSGVLAALGVNTFFTGYSAETLGINQYIADDPAKFAASQGGIGADTENAVLLADLMDTPIASRDGQSLAVLYERLVGETTQASAMAQASAEGARVFEETLRGQKMATSGVSIDEEAIKLIQFQRMYQAAARYITTLNELFGILVQI